MKVIHTSLTATLQDDACRLQMSYFPPYLGQILQVGREWEGGRRGERKEEVASREIGNRLGDAGESGSDSRIRKRTRGLNK